MGETVKTCETTIDNFCRIDCINAELNNILHKQKLYFLQKYQMEVNILVIGRSVRVILLILVEDWHGQMICDPSLHCLAAGRCHSVKLLELIDIKTSIFILGMWI